MKKKTIYNNCKWINKTELVLNAVFELTENSTGRELHDINRYEFNNRTNSLTNKQIGTSRFEQTTRVPDCASRQ